MKNVCLPTLWKPEVYQGKRSTHGYFEGWYYKVVSSDESNVLAVIPGVSFGKKSSDRHAFIQFIDANTASSRYFKYDIDKFSFSKDELLVKIGGSTFRRDGIDLNISEAAGSINGKLDFHDLRPWPVSVFSPGAMGYFAFVPFMQCYHGVISFDHRVNGHLSIDGNLISLEGGRGYIEKDWGRSFPRYHIWLQSNHFDTPGTSLMLSFANVPWLGRSFDGFIIGLLYAGRLYRFTTYNGSRLEKINLVDGKLELVIKSARYQIEVACLQSEGIALKAPVQGEMRAVIQENLSSHVFVRLSERTVAGAKLIFEGKGRHAGIEIVGKPEDMAAMLNVYRKGHPMP